MIHLLKTSCRILSIAKKLIYFVFFGLFILSFIFKPDAANAATSYETAAVSVDPDPRQSMVIDSSGGVHASAFIFGQGLTYIYKNGDSWYQEQVDPNGRCSTIMLGADSQPVIVYASEEGVSCAVRQPSGIWNKEKIDSCFGWPFWAAVDSSGSVHVIYDKDMMQTNYAARQVDGTWRQEVVSQTGLTWIPWIGVEADGSIVAFHNDDTNFCISRRSAAGWNTYPIEGLQEANWFSGTVHDGTVYIAMAMPNDSGKLVLKWGTLSGSTVNFQGELDYSIADWQSPCLPVSFAGGSLAAAASGSDKKPLVCACDLTGYGWIINGPVFAGAALCMAEGAGGDLHLMYRSLAGDLVYCKMTDGPAKLDPISPHVLTTYPLNSATNVTADTTKKVTVYFNETVEAGDNFKGVTLYNGTSPVDAAVTVERETLIIKIAYSLLFDAEYSVEIPAGAVKDQMGNPNEKSYSFNFKTLPAPLPQSPQSITQWTQQPSGTAASLKGVAYGDGNICCSC